MDIVASIKNEAAQLGEPLERVLFGYFPSVDGQRVADPPEIEEVIDRVGSREVPWDDAVPSLNMLGSKPAPHIRADTTNHTMCFGHVDGGWRLFQKKRRPGRR